MNRIDRLQAIIIQLQTKKVVKAHEIADRFEISLRTVYRDIRAIEEAGVPIGAEAGVGYFLLDNYSLPPIMFTANEASSLLLAGKFIPSIADKAINDSFVAAMHKIKAVLSSDQKDLVNKLETSMQVHTNDHFQTPINKLYIQEIQQALMHQKVVEISYFSNYNQCHSKRKIEPIALIYYAMNWHVIAFCRLRSAFRDFRLDRIEQVTVLEEVYDRELDKDYKQYLDNEKEKMNLHAIKLKVDKIVSSWINETKYWYGFTNLIEIGDEVKMEFLNPNLEGFARWLLTLGEGVHIIEPIALKEHMKTLVKSLNKKYL